LPVVGALAGLFAGDKLPGVHIEHELTLAAVLPCYMWRPV